MIRFFRPVFRTFECVAKKCPSYSIRGSPTGEIFPFAPNVADGLEIV
jgi:hypothetical protein